MFNRIHDFVFYFICFLVFSSSALCQDIIIKNDKSEIKAKVIEIQPDVIKYREYDHLDGPIRNIPVSLVFMILYENGSRETFNPEPHNKGSTERLEKSARIENNYNHQKKEQSSPKSDRLYKDPSKNGFVLGGRVGLYIPFEQVVYEIYGPGIMWGFFTGYWNGRLGFEVDWKRYQKTGTPYSYGSVISSSASMKLDNIILTGYVEYYKKGNFVMYAGLGAGYSSFMEVVEAKTLSGSATDEVKLNGFEIHSTVGFMFRPVYLEITLSSISLADVKINPGGLLINLGLVF